MYSQTSNTALIPEATFVPPATTDEPSVLVLIRDLCHELQQSGVRYCHWKSNEAIDKSATGDNDLDLLVNRDDANTFLEILARLGFKEARPAADKELPGVFHFFGYDHASDRYVHVHAHYQLVLGHDATKNYHLPIERAYVESSTMDVVFPLPSAEFEFVVFIIRMVLKHATWDAILTGQAKLSKSEERELNDLLERSDEAEVARILRTALPHVSQDAFDSCAQAFSLNRSYLVRWRAGRRLLCELRPYARRTILKATCLKWWRIAKWGTRRFILGLRSKKNLSHGGALIAVIGADGSGKSSVIASLEKWLGAKFHLETRHMGKPPWSASTYPIKLAIKALRRSKASDDSATQKGSFWLLLWHVVTARDRYRNYMTARRAASNGAIVLCDRFPLANVKSMDRRRSREIVGDRPTGWLTRTLAAMEDRYYRAMSPPDVLIVLRVSPDVAVARRADEPEMRSRSRAEEVQSIDWSQTGALVVDADQTMEEVHAQVKQIVWSQL